MKCPLCFGPYALDWWCVNCHLSRKDAEDIAWARDMMKPKFTDLLYRILIVFLASCLGLVILCGLTK